MQEFYDNLQKQLAWKTVYNRTEAEEAVYTAYNLTRFSSTEEKQAVGQFCHNFVLYSNQNFIASWGRVKLLDWFKSQLMSASDNALIAQLFPSRPEAGLSKAVFQAKINTPPLSIEERYARVCIELENTRKERDHYKNTVDRIHELVYS